MRKSNDDLLFPLEELRRDYQNITNASDILDNKLSQILVMSGAIVTISSAINLFDDFIKFDIIGIINFVIVLLYFISIALSLIGTRPINYRTPISPNWEKLDKDFFDKPEREVYKKLIIGYIEQIEYNNSQNKKKQKFYFISLIIISINFLLLSLIIILR